MRASAFRRSGFFGILALVTVVIAIMGPDWTADLFKPRGGRIVNAPIRKIAPYIFYGQTTSMCDTCMALVPAKIIIEDEQRLLSEALQDPWRAEGAGLHRCRLLQALPRLPEARRPAAQPQTRTELGCPYDCGLCPDHEQHSCLALIDVNEACNLTCPVCFADSSTPKTAHRPLAEIERMMDALVASEGEPDLLQISGGEPTIHPQILEIIAAAKRRPIRHIMLNTNGIRIAQEPDSSSNCAAFKPGFEVYLQFEFAERLGPQDTARRRPHADSQASAGSP